jgi:hypothetical protein
MRTTTLPVLFLAPLLGSAQTTSIYQIPAAACASIDQCILGWRGGLVTLNESPPADEAAGPGASGPILTVQSWSSETGFVMLHNYSCSPNMDWTFTAVGKTAAGGTIGTVSAGCSGTDSVTGTAFTLSYAFSAYSYQARRSGKGGGERSGGGR